MSHALARVRGSHRVHVALAFAAIYVIWGTTYLAIRLAVETIPPFLMAGTRFILAGGIAFAFLRARGVPSPDRRQWRAAAIVGAFLLVGGNGLVTWSEQQVPSGIAALVVATVPLWTAALDWLAFRGARPDRRMAGGLVLGLLGIGLLIGPGNLSGAAGIDPVSWLALLLAPALWSYGSLISRGAALPADVFMATAVEMLAGGALLLLAGLGTGELARLEPAAVSSRSLLAMLYLALFGSIVALTAYVWLLKTIQAARVATYTYVNPVIAVLLGWLVLSEPLTAPMLAAVVIIILAVALITARRPRRLPAKETPHGSGHPAALSATTGPATPESERLAV